VKTTLCVVAVMMLTVWVIKRHYSGAGADDLWWILSPTARLVGFLTNTAFVPVAGEGYFSPDQLFLIEKSCAGVNFMIAAFGMIVFALFHRIGSGISGASVLAVSLVASYGAAVLVNAVRITIAMWLAGHPIGPSTVAGADVHRIEGIVVYFAGLVLLCELVRRLDLRAAEYGR